MSTEQPDPRWKSGLHFQKEHRGPWQNCPSAPLHEECYVPARPLELQLPHSCDEWVIGGLESARQFLADLTEAVAEMEKDAAG